MKRLWVVLLAIWPGLSVAFSYVPISDATLWGQAQAVALAQVTGSDRSAAYPAAETRYRLQLIEIYKGGALPTAVDLALPGSAWGRQLRGVPQLENGDSLIVFLNLRNDGIWQATQLSLGIFQLLQTQAGEWLAARTLGEALRVEPTGPLPNAAREIVRPVHELRDWLIARSPVPAAFSGALPLATTPGGTNQKYTLLARGSLPARWFEFDAGRNVTFHAGSTPLQGVNGGGYAEFQKGLNAWTQDVNSNIRLVYGGTTAATAGLRSTDGFNTILFNDPFNEVEGSFDCNGGGVLAVGGYTTTGSVSTYRNITYNVIGEADIVTNDLAGCFFRLNNNSNAAEVFAHELGHAIGFGHSCGDSTLLILSDCTLASSAVRDALMTTNPHADGRGADLRLDDERAAAFVYGQGSTQPDSIGDAGNDGLPQPGTGTNVTNNTQGGGGGGCVAGGSADGGLLILLGLALSGWRWRRLSSP